MGSMVLFSATLLFSFLFSSICGVPGGHAQDLRERDAFCDQRGCYVVYFQRRTFLEAWRACKEDGGNLATIKRPEDAVAVAALFSNADLRQLGPAVRVWIGLQRQPRQCRPSRPLRGFSWTTGDRDTEYTNWQREEPPDSCSAPRCVVMGYDSSLPERSKNFEWLEGTCFTPADGYLCRYTYKGMCPALWSEGAGDALYTTPFNLLTALLTHLPYGTVATVPCPAEEDRTVRCESREGGVAAGWSHDAPLCAADAPAPGPRCGRDNGRCEHFCREAGDRYYCHCSEGFQLADDGHRCEVDVCHGAPCASECLPLPDRYRCACPEGYMLAPDEEGCLDVDECLQSPCEQLCVNSPGSFQCLCREGYRRAADGECRDVDECANDPCEQTCENTPGSHVCRCHMGFSVVPEDPRQCQETDECQIPGTCQQMCVNYVGGFDCYCEEGYELRPDHRSCRKTEAGDDRPVVPPDSPWFTQRPEPAWNPDFFNWPLPTDWPDSLDWLTDPPGVQSSDVIWVTSAPQDDTPFHARVDPSGHEPKDGLGDDGEEEGERFQNVFPWEVEPELTSSAPTHTPPPPPTTTTHTPPPTTTTHTPPPTTTTHTTQPTAPTTHTTQPTAPTTHTTQPTAPTTHTTQPTAPTTHTTPLTTSPTPTPDWDEDEEEEVTTLVPTPPASTTIAEGAWNWFRFGPSPASHEPVTTEYGEPVMDYNISSALDYPDEEEKDFRVLYSSEEPELAEEEKDNGGGQDHFANVQNTTSSSGGGGAASDSGQRDHSEVVKQSTSTWLLVGLLVPICIFVVVMAALGVVYCTRCAVQPRSKSSTDCYHWISGAHDKPSAQTPRAAGGSRV